MSEIIDEFYLENGLFTFILSKKDYEDCEKHSYNSWIRTKEESTYNNCPAFTGSPYWKGVSTTTPSTGLGTTKVFSG